MLHVRSRGDAIRPSAETPLIVWLSPIGGSPPVLRTTRTYRMEQKNKQFVPHLLVVPVGSTVEFPNLDPFFHNVFSLFNGRRFDLGLYQTGQSQSVKLAREGVSYIFCNIHPEMGGIILSLATPFYTISESGDVLLRALPPGTYRLGIWSEQATAESLDAAARTVIVAPGNADLGVVSLESSPGNLRKHSNKYGDRYPFQRP